MKTIHKVLIAVGILVISLGIAVLVIFVSRSGQVLDRAINGEVIRVVDRPNVAEDGYYSIEVRADTGKVYQIDATAYRNIPLNPTDNGEMCVDIPKVQVGDDVSFNLPSNSQPSTYLQTCYNKNLTGYYFNVNE